MKRALLTCGLALLVAAPAAAAPKPLRPGQAMAVSGTDIVCIFGGLAHHQGFGCALNSKATTWVFRLEEDMLVATRVLNGSAQPALARVFHEPHTRAGVGASDVTSGTVEGAANVGQRFTARGTDLVCSVSRVGSSPAVTCAKERGDHAIAGSYAGLLTPTAMRIERVTTHGSWKVVLTRAT
jgi:hypothetical protein